MAIGTSNWNGAASADPKYKKSFGSVYMKIVALIMTGVKYFTVQFGKI